jgi:5-methylcytosine-specific restriction endonuclease McrA
VIGTTTYAIANRGTRQDTRYVRMRTAALKRHPYCTLCLASGPKVKLEVHHKKNWKDYPELRFKASNLTVLCHECHMLMKGSHSRRRGRFKPLSHSPEMIL